MIFMDEIDGIDWRSFSEGSSADREVQRTLMELLNQLDGFDDLGRVKVVMKQTNLIFWIPLCFVQADWTERYRFLYQTNQQELKS